MTNVKIVQKAMNLTLLISVETESTVDDVVLYTIPEVKSKLIKFT